MADKSKIEWTDATWNPATGCTRVSEGCRNCYMARTVPRHGQDPWTVVLHPERLEYPLHWKKPRRIFVNSLSDLFHEDIPDEFIDQVFATMADTCRHTYQILTKRPERMLRYLSPDNPRYSARKVFDLTEGPAGKFDCDIYWPLDNVHLGVSVEDQKTADERIPLLLQTPAAVRFLSCEPLLGPIKFNRSHQYCPTHDFSGGFCSSPCQDQRFADWIIVGGESGPGARPMHPDWARSIRDQCQAAGVPFFFKQWGEFGPYDALKDLTGRYGKGPHRYGHDGAMIKVGKKAAGALLDGKEWKEFPRNTL